MFIIIIIIPPAKWQAPQPRAGLPSQVPARRPRGRFGRFKSNFIKLRLKVSMVMILTKVGIVHYLLLSTNRIIADLGRRPVPRERASGRGDLGSEIT